MKLFLPSARATNVLLIVGFASLGYALYIAIPRSSSRPSARLRRGLDTCFVRHAGSHHLASIFSIRIAALLSPRSICCAIAGIVCGPLAVACLGVVLTICCRRCDRLLTAQLRASRT